MSEQEVIEKIVKEAKERAAKFVAYQVEKKKKAANNLLLQVADIEKGATEYIENQARRAIVKAKAGGLGITVPPAEIIAKIN